MLKRFDGDFLVMKLFAPKYYKKFKCIASECRHSCCVGWEIDLDSLTVEKYKHLPPETSSDILSSIEMGGECNRIRLTEEGRCPFLDGCGLCRLISSYGEDYISEICREHPRFYHRIGERAEVGLGAVCEEACRIILSEGGTELECIGEYLGEPADATDFDTLIYRDRIYSYLADDSLTLGERVERITREFDIDRSVFSSPDVSAALSELEYLDEGHRALFATRHTCAVDVDSFSPELTRYFAYLVFRHVSISESYDALRARVAFCLLLTFILGALVSDSVALLDAARIISEEIEYSEDNTSALIFELECLL